MYLSCVVDMNEQVMYWLAAASNRPQISDPMMHIVESNGIAGGIWSESSVLVLLLLLCSAPLLSVLLILLLLLVLLLLMASHAIDN